MRITMMILAAVLLLLAAGIAPAADSTSRADAPPQATWHQGPPWMLAQADGPGDPRFQGQGRQGASGQMRKHRKHVEQLRLLKMLELLDLADDQSTAFLTAYNSMRRDMREIDEARAKLIDTLSKGLQADTFSDAAIEDLTARVFEQDQRRRQVHDDFLQIARSQLTAKQFGRLVVFHERFERELLDQVRAFREFKEGKLHQEP